jgi:hypothetical protein
MMQCDKCERVSEIVSAESEVIKDHLDKHKYYNHLDTDNEAIADFVKKYAWIMREAYCGSVCRDRNKCGVVPTFTDEPLPDISDEELQSLIKECETDSSLTRIELMIIKKHIRDHKWFHHIPTYKEAVMHFLDCFGWIIRELHRNHSIKNILKEIDS